MKYLLLFVTLVICGCMKTEAAPGDFHPRQPRPEFLDQCGNALENGNVMSCLKLACEKAGGDLSASGCLCPEGFAFHGWQKASCQPIQTDLRCASTGQKRSCALIETSDSENHQVAVTLEHPEEMSSEESRTANWIFRFLPGLQQRRNVTRFAIRPTAVLASDIAQMLQPTSNGPVEHNMAEFSELLPFRDFEALENYISSTKAGTPRLVAQATETQVLLTKAHSKLASFSVKSARALHPLGCLGYCETSSMSSEFPDVTLNRVYRGGVMDSAELVFQSSGTLLRMGTNHQVLFFSHLHWDIGSESFVVEIFEPSGRRWGKKYINDDSRSMPSAFAEIKRRSSTLDSNVVICENDVRPKQLLDFSERIQYGSRSEGYGFSKLSGASSFLFQTQSLNKYFIPENVASDHTKEVLSALVSEDESEGETTGIIPVPSSECLMAQSSTAWDLIANRSRVVNLSGTEMIPPQLCRQEGKFPQLTNGKFLWVVSSGNNEFLGTRTGQHLDLCPQAWSGRSNLIVVAAGQNGYLESYSSAGVHYADIAVSGDIEVNGQHTSATSYASPKVARTAAQLSSKFPNLSLQQIRHAILMSADLYPGLKVRAEGILNNTRARALAQIFSQEPNLPLDQAVKKAVCGRSWRCREMNKRKEIIERILEDERNAP